MTIAEQFLMDNPNIVTNRWQIFREYSKWLKVQYKNAANEGAKKLLQEEADRFSDIYIDCVKRLFNWDK